MQYCKKLMMGLCSFLFVFIFFTVTVLADNGVRPPLDMIGLSIAIVVGAVAVIISFFMFGGIKYVTAENVLDTEVRKNLYDS